MILIRLRRSLPAIVARTVMPASSSIENIPALNFSTTLPRASIESSLGKFVLYSLVAIAATAAAPIATVATTAA